MSRPLLVVLALLAACKTDDKAAPKPKPSETPEVKAKAARARLRVEAPDPYKAERELMVQETIADRGVADPRVLEAMRSVHRHSFVPPEIRDEAYADRALPIGFGLTISQPFIVASMTEAAKIGPGDRVLEIGTGSGYQAAILAELGNKVYTIEIHPELAARTQLALNAAGYGEVNLRVGDGYRGWPEAAPFDAILVTCAAPEIPAPLLDQLVEGGRMVIPVGEDDQYLQVITKTAAGPRTETLMGVRFGPMLGEIRRER